MHAVTFAGPPKFREGMNKDKHAIKARSRLSRKQAGYEGNKQALKETSRL